VGLSKDDILNCDDVDKVEIDVPEWNGKVHIRVLTGAQLGEFQALCMRAREDPKHYKDLLVCLASLSLCDESGNRLIPEGQRGALALKSGAALKRIFDAAIDLNKIDEDAVDELEKNSRADQNADSGSA